MGEIYLRPVGLLILLGFTVIPVTHGVRLLITPSGKQVKTAGTGIIFTCSLIDLPVNGVASPIRWLREDGTLISDTRGSGNHRVYIEQDDAFNQKLYINRITPRDEGRYTCQTRQATGTLAGQVEIAIYEEIRFDGSPRYVEHRVGSSPLIPCRARGQPEPVISWRFRRRRIPVVSQKYQYEDDGLRINEISAADNGTYECRAEVDSQGSLRVWEVTLSVLFPPKITLAPETTSVVKGQRVTLRCQATGNPAPEYEWYKEHSVSDLLKVKVPLDKNDRFKTTHGIEDASEEDEGTYFCKVRNDLGTDERQAELTLMIPPTIDDLPFKIQGEEDTMDLPCYARGIPTPDVTWQRVGNLYPYREGEQRHDGRVLVDNTEPGVSRLVISGTEAADSGTYTCIANNPAGSQRRNTTVTVQYEPSMLTHGRQYHAWPGQTRMFNCTANGLPEPDITWFRGQEYLRANATYMIVGKRGSSIVQVTVEEGNDWVYGTFSCMAKNIRGHKTTHFNLVRADPPTMPRNVTVVEETPVTVTLVADAPTSSGGLEIKLWMVQYRLAEETSELKKLYFQTGHKMTVNGLTPDTLYDFYLAAGNDVGYGKEVKFKVRTPQLAPLVPPKEAPTDPPHKTQPNPTGGNSTVMEAKQPKVPDNIPVFKSSENTEESPLPLILGASIAGFVLIVFILIIFIIIRKRKKRNDHPYGVTTVVKKRKGDRHSKDIDSMQLSIRRKNSPLPLPPTTPKMAERKISDHHLNGHVMHTSPPSRHHDDYGERPPSDVPTINIVGNPNCEAKFAWDMMLRRQDLETSDDENRPESDGDLPPPPPFMLDSATGAYRQGTHHDYQDIFDGYHSGDNIDTDIEEVTDDLRIQLPSYDDIHGV